jgi:hypothetical protein
MAMDGVPHVVTLASEKLTGQDCLEGDYCACILSAERGVTKTYIDKATCYKFVA